MYGSDTCQFGQHVEKLWNKRGGLEVQLKDAAEAIFEEAGVGADFGGAEHVEMILRKHVTA